MARRGGVRIMIAKSENGEYIDTFGQGNATGFVYSISGRDLAIVALRKSEFLWLVRKYIYLQFGLSHS